MVFLFPTEGEGRQFMAARPEAEAYICGVGLAECAASLTKLIVDGVCTPQKRVVLAGIAGCYNLESHPIDMVVEVSCEQIAEMPALYSKKYETQTVFNLPQASSNSVSDIKRPRGETEIENMEGASIFAICNMVGIPVSQIRAISNHVDQPMSEWHDESAISALTSTLIDIYDNSKR